MKLVTYLPTGRNRARVGVLTVHAGIDYVVDAATAYARVLRDVEHDPYADEVAAARVPCDMTGLLAGGDASLAAVRRGAGHIEAALARGEPPSAFAAAGALHERAAVKLLAPIPRPGKIVAIGANYHEHVREGRETGAIAELPPYPPAFLKMSSAVVGPDDPIVYPDHGFELDYEVELSMVIGRSCQDIDAEHWLDHVAGFTIVNDLSLRDVILQERETGPVFYGKNFATACPMGPCIVTKDDIRSPHGLALRLRVNGELRQRDSTASMIHSCGAVLAYWSRLGLEPGDVVTTGTPGGGAGFRRKHPERLLKVGDVVEAEIEGIGVLRNAVVARPAAAPAHRPANSQRSGRSWP